MPSRPFSAAVASFESFHLDPVAALTEPRERDATQIADASAHLSGNALGKRLHDRVSERIARTETRDDSRWEVGVRKGSLRRDNVDRTRQPHVLRHVAVDGAVEKDGSKRQPDREVDV